MNHYVLFSFAIILAYLLGSIPTSYLIGKIFFKIDIRNYGSGNVGATNALRVLGVKTGLIVLLFDIFKGFIVVQLSKVMLLKYVERVDIFLVFIGMAAILGHIFTVFLKFKGGKGVATSTGVFLALIPIPFIFALSVFLLVVIISKYVSLGSLAAATVLFVSELIVNIPKFQELEYLVLTAIVVIFIFIKHKANIRRLINGNENKLNFKKKGDKS